ncbi:MAG: phenylalanine--tRNA ligase subunit beta, partial [Oscillospiraceae bacterium]|nr:phenylalanine--tRNA ligase subunit beta [Oscillospiraceae bacterium]
SKNLSTLPFDPQWVNTLIGIDLPADEQKEILARIGFKVENDVITIPSFRNDIEHQADISEEIARFYGYGNIPSSHLSGVAMGSLTSEQLFIRLVENTLIGYGLCEITTYSFISPKAYDKICLPQNHPLRNCVVISNPLGEDTSVMRTTAIPSMLDVLSRNYNNRNSETAFYEISTEYIPVENRDLPLEKRQIVIGMYGENFDFFSLKGAVEELLYKAGIGNYDIKPCSDFSFFHPGRTAVIVKDNIILAGLGEVHPTVLDNYEIGVRAYVATLDLEALMDHKSDIRNYKPLPKYPSTNRDLSFVCDDELPVGDIQKVIVRTIGDILESITLFDVYRGEQIPHGKKSIAFNLRLRSPFKTLTDDECDRAVGTCINALKDQGITLRS